VSDLRSGIIMVVKKIINFWQLNPTQPNPFHRQKCRTQPNPTQPIDESNPWPCLSRHKWDTGRCSLRDTGRGLMLLKSCYMSKNVFFEKPMYEFLLVVQRDHSSKCVSGDRKTNEQTDRQTNRKTSPSRKTQLARCAAGA